MTVDESDPPPIAADARSFGQNSDQHRTGMRDVEPAPRSALGTQREVMWKYGVSAREINAFLGRVISPLLSLRFQKATPDSQPVSMTKCVSPCKLLPGWSAYRSSICQNNRTESIRRHNRTGRPLGSAESFKPLSNKPAKPWHPNAPAPNHTQPARQTVPGMSWLRISPIRDPFLPGRPTHRGDTRIVLAVDDVSKMEEADFRVCFGFHKCSCCVGWYITTIVMFEEIQQLRHRYHLEEI